VDTSVDSTKFCNTLRLPPKSSFASWKRLTNLSYLVAVGGSGMIECALEHTVAMTGNEASATALTPRCLKEVVAETAGCLSSF
jgi:hypothetical protein